MTHPPSTHELRKAQEAFRAGDIEAVVDLIIEYAAMTHPLAPTPLIPPQETPGG